MKMIMTATAAALALTVGAASAADLPNRRAAPAAPIKTVAPAYKWTGAYVGVNAGYTTGNFTKARGSEFKDPTGASVGGQIGYNQQYSNNIVVGVEGDLNWTDAKGKASSTGTAGTKAEIDYTTTARVRAGYAFDRVMPYVTAGYAGAQQKVSGSGSSFRSGYALGGGVEAGVTNNVTAKVEALYMDLGAKNTSSGKLGTDLMVVRGGLNYKF